MCRAGQRGPPGSCSSCTAGQYQNQNQHTSNSCYSCSKGQYQDQNGRSSCKACPSGQYTDSNAQVRCKYCVAGQYNPSTNQPSCKDCGVGLYQPAQQTTSCKNCPIGWYQGATGRSQCNGCQPGQYQSQNAKTSCVVCPVGKKQPSSNQGSCPNCIAGQYQNLQQKTGCIACSTGRSQNSQGQTSCPFCAVGFYQAVTGGNTAPSICQGACDAGFHCPSGSVSKTQENCPTPGLDMSEWANYYCSGNGSPRRIVPNGKMSVPANGPIERRTGIADCPVEHFCSKGIAYPMLSFDTPENCKLNAVYQTTAMENTGNVEFGEDFRITTKKTELDVASNTLTYRIFRSPQGCAKGRADDGIASFPGSAEFNVLTKSGATPTLVPGKLQTLKTLNCEG